MFLFTVVSASSHSNVLFTTDIYISPKMLQKIALFVSVLEVGFFWVNFGKFETVEVLKEVLSNSCLTLNYVADGYKRFIVFSFCFY
jgi:hypothetical protein